MNTRPRNTTSTPTPAADVTVTVSSPHDLHPGGVTSSGSRHELGFASPDPRHNDSGYTTNSPDTPASSTHARTATATYFRFDVTPPLATAAVAMAAAPDEEYQDEDYENNNTDDDIVDDDIEDDVFVSESVTSLPPGTVTFPAVPLRVPALYPGRLDVLTTPPRVYTVSSAAGPRFSTGSAPTHASHHGNVTVGTQTSSGGQQSEDVAVAMAALNITARATPQHHLRVLQSGRHHSDSGPSGRRTAPQPEPPRSPAPRAPEPDRARSEPSMRQQVERQFGQQLRRISDEFHSSYSNQEQVLVAPRRPNGYVRCGRASVDVLQARRASQRDWWQRIIQMIAPRSPPAAPPAAHPPLPLPRLPLAVQHSDSNGETARCDDEVDALMSRDVQPSPDDPQRRLVPGETQQLLGDDVTEDGGSDASTLDEFMTAPPAQGSGSSDTDIEDCLETDPSP